jgi:Ca-activated chloride channel family protein
MTLLYPGWLWLLIPLALLWYYRPRRLTDSVHLMILALLLLALSRPVIEQKETTGEIESREFIIALDVSYSMRAQDIPPDRYRYAEAVIEAILQENQTDHIMLIAFTTNPLLLSPPTTDHALISVALKSLDPKNILTRGTSLRRLFEKVATLPLEEKQLVLLTDGGEEEDLETLVGLVRENGIALTILALGTPAGTTIHLPNGSLLKDSEGNLVVSRINPLLKKLAQATGGTYLPAPARPQVAAEAILQSLEEKAAHGETIEKKRQGVFELYTLPLLLAILLFFILHTRMARYLLLIPALWGSPLNASLFDAYRLHQAYEAYEAHDFNRSQSWLDAIDTPSLQSEVAKAATLYKKGNYRQALRTYRSIRSTSPTIKQSLYYNIANCYAQLHAYKKAVRYYLKALQLGDDEDALHNLRLLLREKKEEENRLAFSRPVSQGGDTAKPSEAEEAEESATKDEQNAGGGSGSGGESKTKEQEKQRHITLVPDKQKEKQPLGSKVYDLINKGYIHEKEPW